VLNKKIWANFQRIIELFTQKIVIKLSKRWVWDPEKNLFRIPDPGVKKAPNPGSATLPPTVTHCLYIPVLYIGKVGRGKEVREKVQ
jgi:hypothetical protein